MTLPTGTIAMHCCECCAKEDVLTRRAQTLDAAVNIALMGQDSEAYLTDRQRELREQAIRFLSKAFDTEILPSVL